MFVLDHSMHIMGEPDLLIYDRAPEISIEDVEARNGTRLLSYKKRTGVNILSLSLIW
jgi:hypothetical protein